MSASKKINYSEKLYTNWGCNSSGGGVIFLDERRIILDYS